VQEPLRFKKKYRKEVLGLTPGFKLRIEKYCTLYFLVGKEKVENMKYKSI